MLRLPVKKNWWFLPVRREDGKGWFSIGDFLPAYRLPGTYISFLNAAAFGFIITFLAVAMTARGNLEERLWFWKFICQHFLKKNHDFLPAYRLPGKFILCFVEKAPGLASCFVPRSRNDGPGWNRRVFMMFKIYLWAISIKIKVSVSWFYNEFPVIRLSFRARRGIFPLTRARRERPRVKPGVTSKSVYDF